MAAFDSRPSRRIGTLRHLVQISHIVWGQLTVAVATFVGMRLYTELLDRGEFGMSMLGLGAIAFLDGLTVMALSQTMTALCSRLSVKKERRVLSSGLAVLAFAAVGLLVVVGAVSIALVSLFWPGLLHLWWLPVVILVYLAVEFAKVSVQSLQVIEADYLRFSLWSAGEAAIGVAIICGMLVVWQPSWMAFLIAHVLSRLISCSLFTLLFTRDRHWRVVDLSVARKALAEALRYGAPVAAMAPLGWISTFLDRFIIASLLGTATTGVYVAATSLVSRPYALTTSILTNYFRPQLYAGATTEGGAPNRAVAGRWLVAASIIGLAGSGALWLLGTPIVTLMLAADYRIGAVALMVGFGCAQTLSIMTHALDNAILATGRSASLLKIQTGLSIATLTLIPLGIWWHGAFGAVMARAVAELIKFGGTLLLTIHITAAVRSRAATAYVPGAA